MKFWVDGSGFNGRESRFCVVDESGDYEIMRTDVVKTNNTMEYRALIDALLKVHKGDEIFTDSQLVVGQVVKGWKVKAKHLQIFVDEAKRMIKTLDIKLTWIPREENKAGIILDKSR